MVGAQRGFLAALIASLSLDAAIIVAAEPENAPVNRESYELVFQEHPRLRDLQARQRTRDAITADVFDASLPPEKVTDALVELALSLPPEEIPWKKLLELAERPDIPESVELWAVVVAGKGLCCSPRPRELERWLFRQLKGGPHIQSATVVLGVSRIAARASMREWSRLLRDPATADETCASICMYVCVWGGVYQGGTLDEGINCLLAGYDETASSTARKLLIWEWLSLTPGGEFTRGHVEEATFWSLHQLAMLEFANEQNPDELRATATTGLRRGEPITQSAFAAAKKIRDESLGIERLRAAANHILENAEKYGVEK